MCLKAEGIEVKVVAILASIEHLRQKMHELVEVYGIGSHQALIASQQLDAELNAYYTLQRNVEKIAS
ncbi:aspartyl-phosphate phosphatase Spo0E family protein [Sporomusa sp. KB1]|uniref:aspartyl-phosphate phosphatase Spo0E family protein n=1 Tax=Sporomusa sp. KB1 TaxID=943346 RepID=UPI001C95ACF2|nr:aspartyl-phosphate phosphatase Spo0E family protein [Sporomusa sp. KB1]